MESLPEKSHVLGIPQTVNDHVTNKVISSADLSFNSTAAKKQISHKRMNPANFLRDRTMNAKITSVSFLSVNKS
jgi:hypothetical protein